MDPVDAAFGVELEPELVAFGGSNVASTGRTWAGIRLAVTNPGAIVTEHGRYRFVPLG